MNRLYSRLFFLFFTLITTSLFAQEKEEESKVTFEPLKFSLNEDGSSYVRVLAWGQFKIDGTQGQEDFTITPQIRRARALAYAQISSKFLVLAHAGLNSLSPNKLTKLGTESNASQVFLHDLWGEYNWTKSEAFTFTTGGGLHYWNGINRMGNHSTISMLTMDNPTFGWPQIGFSDQMARHIGLFAKGNIDRLEYRVAWNVPMSNSADVGNTLTEDSYSYNTRKLYSAVGSNKGMSIFQGYFAYQFKDRESTTLPFKTGTYLGKKSVFNIGAGFFHHKDGVIKLAEGGSIDALNTFEGLEKNTITSNVTHLSVDAFYDAPLGNGALTAYATYMHMNYGEDFTGRVSSGDIAYAHLGYLLPPSIGDGKLQPYVSYGYTGYEAYENAGNEFGAGLNYYFSGHNAKVTFEYKYSQAAYDGLEKEDSNVFAIQTQICL
ncbi:hypothetical protein [Sediminitomix flava]|uniref:Short chain amide porin n=1 Tax=Sediminitomix flava TaxID=379075 RepID=A0A315ZGX5_SEDFL|nr:hypothetical protein [Sediminitomix flava]PWJ44602.1 short chain amide porin [Sediminitomix flava]